MATSGKEDRINDYGPNNSTEVQTVALTAALTVSQGLLPLLPTPRPSAIQVLQLRGAGQSLHKACTELGQNLVPVWNVHVCINRENENTD